MAQNPTFQKRQKELARIEWQKEKAAKRKQRKLEKQERARTGGIEPVESVQPEGAELPAPMPEP